MRIAAVIAAMSLAVSCATPTVPLSEQKTTYPQLDIALADTDDKVFISTSAQPTSYSPAVPIVLPPEITRGQAAATIAAGALIAGLIIEGIESAERSDAAKDVLPVQEALGDARFGPPLRTAIVDEVRELDWTTIEEVHVMDMEDKDALRNVMTTSQTPGVLTITTSNFFSRNASTLVFIAHATIIPKAGEPSRRGRVRIPVSTFSTSVGFEVEAPVAGSRRVDFIPTWAANEAELVRAAAAQAQPILVELIGRQLRDGNIQILKPEGSKWDHRSVHLYGTPLRMRAEVIENHEDGELIRVDGGALFYKAFAIKELEEATESLITEETLPPQEDLPFEIDDAIPTELPESDEGLSENTSGYERN